MNDEQNYNSNQTELDSAFLFACEKRDFVKAEKLLGLGANIYINKPHTTISTNGIIEEENLRFNFFKPNNGALSRLNDILRFLEAARSGDMKEVVKFLKNKNTDEFVINQALIKACEHGGQIDEEMENKSEIAALLMRKGANPNFHFMRNSEGQPHSALNNANPEVKGILQALSLSLATTIREADRSNAINDELDHNPDQYNLDYKFLQACKKYDFVEAESLLNSGANLFAHNAEVGVAVLDSLDKAGKGLNKKSFKYIFGSKENKAALSKLKIARKFVKEANWGHKEKVEKFLEKNTFSTSVLNMALIRACEKYTNGPYPEDKLDHNEVCKKLIEKGANPNFYFYNQNGRKISAMIIATDPAIKRMFLHKGLGKIPNQRKRDPKLPARKDKTMPKLEKSKGINR